jgi:hypothetical protein
MTKRSTRSMTSWCSVLVVRGLSELAVDLIQAQPSFLVPSAAFPRVDPCGMGPLWVLDTTQGDAGRTAEYFPQHPLSLTRQFSIDSLISWRLQQKETREKQQ